ncbi:MAG TPA: ABC transporter permease subunit [Oculatellaceae cyanobacterium]|jgi:osmoprotectant transport system permease protein
MPASLQLAMQYIIEHPARFADALQTHLLLSGCALSSAFLLAFPLGILLAQLPAATRWIAGLSMGLRVIPSLVVLALVIPWLGTGFQPSLLALIILAIPPILIQTVQGVSRINPAILEAAQGMGMSDLGIFQSVTLPLALPFILAGLRAATTEVLASATIAALIGGGGLGVFIINGLALYHIPMLLVGAIPVVLLVLLAESFLALLERLTTRHLAC